MKMKGQQRDEERKKMNEEINTLLLNRPQDKNSEEDNLLAQLQAKKSRIGKLPDFEDRFDYMQNENLNQMNMDGGI